RSPPMKFQPGRGGREAVRRFDFARAQLQGARMPDGPRNVAAAPRPAVPRTRAAETTAQPQQGPAGMQCGASMGMPQHGGWQPGAAGANAPRGVPPPTAALGPPVDITSLSAADRKKVATLWNSFGPKMVPMHEAWHSQNGSGGTRGPGSGEKFV